jgi:replicative DNA helicase
MTGGGEEDVLVQEARVSSAPVSDSDYVERVVLGSIIVEPRIYEDVSGFLWCSHFKTPASECVYDFLRHCLERGRPLVRSEIMVHLSNSVAGVEFDHVERLVRLAVPRDAAVECAKRILDLHLRRRLAALCEDTFRRIGTVPALRSARDEVLRLEEELRDLSSEGPINAGPVDFKTVLVSAIREMETATDRLGDRSGLSTGFPDIDRETGGLRRGELFLIAGRPWMCADALALGMAADAALAHRSAPDGDGTSRTISGAKVAFFSMRTASAHLAQRILSRRTGVSFHRMRNGSLTAEEMEKVVVAAQNTHAIPLFIDHGRSLSAAELRSRVEALVRRYGIDLVVVDSLELLTTSGVSEEKPRKKAAQRLKQMAEDLGVAVVAVQSLPGIDAKGDFRRPWFHEALEAGEIDDVADVVALAHREQYYLERSEPSRVSNEVDEDFRARHEEWARSVEYFWNMAEIYVTKPRFGVSGYVRLSFAWENAAFGAFKPGGDDDSFDI